VTAIPDDVVLDIAITQLHGSRVIGYIYKWFFANVCCCQRDLFHCSNGELSPVCYSEFLHDSASVQLDSGL
jgi:hypothetical protein